MSEYFILHKHPNRINELRRERKVTLKVLAQRAGIGESTLYNMKNEKWGGSIRAEIAERIAAALGEEPENVFPDYARAKREHRERMEAGKEHIFSSREERDEAIKSVLYLAFYIAKKNEWRMQESRNNVMDIEDLAGEALLELVEAAERIRVNGIKKGVEFSKYAGWSMEYRFKGMQQSQNRQKRAAYFNVSFDAKVPNSERTYQDYLESIMPRTKTPEEIVVLREECREALLMLSPEQRHEPEIVELARQIGI